MIAIRDALWNANSVPWVVQQKEIITTDLCVG